MALKIPVPGALVDGKYRLAERIGGGGMGDVFRAENVIAGRPVAIKFLHPELADDAELCQRFFQEAQAVNRIRHPNIVDVLDAGSSEMGPYLVMEHLDGESVGSALTRVARLEVDAAFGTMAPVLEALEAAHRVGVVHRDLKPENVFLALDAARAAAVVRLLDFGIAKVLAGTGPSPRTRTGIVFGTPDYLSPEQATGEGPLDGRSDLFAVGVLLYELLTGARPFRAPTAVATAFRVVHAAAPTLAAAGVHVHADVEALIARLLQKDPAKRFQSAGEVLREIDRIGPDAARRSAAVGRLLQVTRRLARAAPSRDPRDAKEAPIRIPTPPESGSALGSAATGRSGAPSSARERVASRPPSPGGAPISARPPQRSYTGRFQVRGPVVRAVDRAVADAHGKHLRDRVVAGMPERYAADLRNDSINALVSYDLEAIDAYMELATATVLQGIGAWRDLGRLSVVGELESALRSAIRPGDLQGAVRRGIPAWSRLLCFGSWKATDRAPGKVLLQIGELEPVSLPLRLWLVGVIEETARRATKADVKASITLGEIGFAPDLACELTAP